MITLHPYVETGGAWSVSEEGLRALWQHMQEEGTYTATWHNGEETVEKWLRYLRDPRNVVVLVQMDGEYVAVAWINGISRNAAFVHHWFSKAVWGGLTLRIAHELLSYWFGFRGADGQPLFLVLIGQTPPHNTLAIRFAAAMGFELCGAIPHVDGTGLVFSYLTRERFYEQEGRR